ncbi:MAG: hypothetical protein QM539_10205 [Alphaproteobacteria bacterium]|nr:hypothetical protein [Alphaproteobacteria bacterium]
MVQVAGGGNHSLALQSNGTVVAWGYNYYGETNVPNGLTDVVAIAACTAYSVALVPDGSVVAWPSNNVYILPNGLSNVVSIALGFDHALAIFQIVYYLTILNI